MPDSGGVRQNEKTRGHIQEHSIIVIPEIKTFTITTTCFKYEYKCLARKGMRKSSSPVDKTPGAPFEGMQFEFTRICKMKDQGKVV
jgi:hypothetical protein